MPHARFAIRHLFVLLALTGLASVSLVYATQVWAAIWFSTSMAVLLMALALSFLSSGRSKAFWLGVAVFGWGYWGILHSPLLQLDMRNTGWRLQSDAPLASSQFLDWMYVSVLAQVHEQPDVDMNGIRTNDSRYPAGPDFSRVGHSQMSLAIAIIGGFAVAAMSGRGESRVDS